MNQIVAACHLHVAAVVRPGDVVVDATAGNGNDTLFLARLVGQEGFVHSFDIQPAALSGTRKLLVSNGLDSRVTLHPCSHSQMSDHVRPGLKSVLFNLGYLPGGDKTIVTTPETTRTALSVSLGLLSPGGLLAIVSYSGHPGGKAEESMLGEFCSTLQPKYYSSMCLTLLNKPNLPPKLWLINKTVR